jgi:hypothetical protein
MGMDRAGICYAVTEWQVFGRRPLSLEHFMALENDVEFIMANNYTTFSEKVSAKKPNNTKEKIDNGS